MKLSIWAFLLLTCLSFVSVGQSKMIIKEYDGKSTAFNLSDVSSVYFITNLIENGNFTDSLDNWIRIGVGINPYHPADPGRAGFTIEDGVLVIDITNQGTDPWSVMLYQSVNFEKNATYTVSFEAKADYACQIISNITQDVTWTNFSGDRKFDLTDSMKQFSYDFTMPQNGPALFQYYLGMIGTGKIYIDNIVIVRK